MTNVNCVYFQSDGKCKCKELKRWYGKPRCIQLVDWNEFCKHKVIPPRFPLTR